MFALCVLGSEGHFGKCTVLFRFSFKEQVFQAMITSDRSLAIWKKISVIIGAPTLGVLLYDANINTSADVVGDSLLSINRPLRKDQSYLYGLRSSSSERK
jgi:hypothetical protein